MVKEEEELFWTYFLRKEKQMEFALLEKLIRAREIYSMLEHIAYSMKIASMNFFYALTDFCNCKS